MILDPTIQIQELIKKMIDERISNLPISFPCKVQEVQEDGVFVKVETLLKASENDIEKIIPILQSPYFTLPIKQGDIGLALNCSFLFEVLMSDEEISENQPTLQENGLFFVPLVSKENFKGEVNKTSLTSQTFDSKLTFSEKSIQWDVLDGSTLKTSLVQNDTSFSLKCGEQTKASIEDSAISFETSQTIELKTQSSSLSLGNETSLKGNTLELSGASASVGKILNDICEMLLKANLDPVAGNGAPLNSPNLATTLPQIIAEIKANFK